MRIYDFALRAFKQWFKNYFPNPQSDENVERIISNLFFYAGKVANGNISVDEAISNVLFNKYDKHAFKSLCKANDKDPNVALEAMKTRMSSLYKEQLGARFSNESKETDPKTKKLITEINNLIPGVADSISASQEAKITNFLRGNGVYEPNYLAQYFTNDFKLMPSIEDLITRAKANYLNESLVKEFLKNRHC